MAVARDSADPASAMGNGAAVCGRDPVARDQGLKEGREEARVALVQTLERVVHAVGLELNEARRTRLETASFDELGALMEHVVTHEAWPDG